ncbi:LysE/ArgO family amino acid transporter [Saccharopolyspora griseoalba]|uniref:LysE/ArgO family amino acid transporter n=1 Tax=Saccharopolyspora griseoalba TaxID=1431848 RepID=A0ABW2LC47_9PSEU
MGSALPAAAAGFGTCLSLIVSIGAQNAFVLRQGLRRHAVPLVVAICIASDVALIAIGVGGFAGIVSTRPWLMTAAAICGGLFVIGYGLLAARRAFRPGALEVGAQATGSRRRAALTCLGVTWLNPQAHLEAVFIIGSVAAGYGALRWEFGAGALAASCVWFISLGFGARLLAGLFTRPAAWRVLDGAIATIMVTLGTSLLLTA